MPMRLCSKCKSAENPLSRLRFRKSRVDGQIYCENCEPTVASVEIPEVTHSPLRAPDRKASAGYVVVNCPDCAGGVHRPKQKPCAGCAGYGAVRIEAAMLNVYRPQPQKAAPAPQFLTES